MGILIKMCVAAFDMSNIMWILHMWFRCSQTEEPASEPPESVDKEVNGEITTEKVESSETETDSVDVVEKSSTHQEFAGAGSTLLEIVARQFLRSESKTGYTLLTFSQAFS